MDQRELLSSEHFGERGEEAHILRAKLGGSPSSRRRRVGVKIAGAQPAYGNQIVVSYNGRTVVLLERFNTRRRVGAVANGIPETPDLVEVSRGFGVLQDGQQGLQVGVYVR